MKHVFVIGLTDPDLERLRRIGGADGLRFHSLFHHDEIRGLDAFPIDDLLREADRRLDEANSEVDGIIGYWDFPVSEMIPILCGPRGLPSASLESILRCQHKYWGRLEQRRVVPEHTPEFALVQPYEEAPQPPLPYPFWLKPVRSYRSHLGFRIADRRAFDRAVDEIRRELPRISEPFGRILDRVELPPEVASAGEHACIAEAIIGGRQCTLEGYAHRGDVRVYGVVDSIRYPNSSSFARYQYPSALPRQVKRRMAEAAERFIAHVGYDAAPFNMEFFYDRPRDRIHLLEVNTRISHSHTDLFEKVDGVSNQEVSVDLALGMEPRPPHRRGEFRHAAKCFVRRFSEGTVRRVPTPDEIAELERAFPGTTVHLEVDEGTRLGDLPDQDAYSYELAAVYVGAQSRRDLLRRYREIASRLRFEFDEAPRGLA